MSVVKSQGLDILVEDLAGSLWVAAIQKGNRLAALEIDPYAELVRWGSIYWAKVMRVDASINAAFVDMGYDVVGMLPASEIPGLKKGAKIGKHLRNGQFVMVQVKTARQPEENEEGADPRPDAMKASKVSMDIALQGRYLIYTPHTPGNRISRRIKDPTVRKQLMAMGKNIKDVEGCILRASASYTQTDMLVREARIQKAIWDSLQEFTKDREPALLMLGPDALQRVLADFATSHVASVQISDPERRTEADNWCDLYAPELMAKLQDRKVTGTRTGMGLMEAHDLLGQIEGFVRPYVILDSGGSIVIQDTAIGTMIDVNTGAGANAAAVNHDAAIEIARQIRLRNIGGTILIDFAGLNNKADQKRLATTLLKAFDLDPCTVELHGVTRLGLFEISRHRRTPSLMDRVELMQGQTDA
ncbi:MAG: S1 RNA-binding domain-containing protein [Proteobacteria bacterium]|nr:S1 RNA-binding domain-containing protein [Pseudomonadota bacterium]